MKNVEQAIAEADGAVPLLRNSPVRAHTFPVAAEFTNWRTEQRSWREGTALLDQSHHMTNLYIKGPDALALLTYLGVNSFATFVPGRAKQFLAVSGEGYYIGDAILFYLEDELFDLVGHPMSLDWVRFHVETGDWNVTTELDDNSFKRQGPPKVYRYERQGPTADQILQRVTGAPLPDVKFFHMTEFTIAGHRVRGLRHGMAGAPGFELFGPWEQGAEVHAALLEAGQGFGIVQVGAKAYSTANLESGWIPSPMSAIYAGESTKAYREWLGSDHIGSLGGSFDSDHIDDYFHTPYDLGYGRLVVFDHDFIGRAALERIAEEPRREKVTLVWNSDDVVDAWRSFYSPGVGAKFIDLPKARYSLFQSDKVLVGDEVVGISMDAGYLVNEREMLSLATVDIAHAEPGTEVVVVWGESPNSTKPNVEEHRQMSIRATVQPAPYITFARLSYRADA
jgi:glycine cleavage system aminomethyltransferase T